MAKEGRQIIQEEPNSTYTSIEKTGGCTFPRQTGGKLAILAFIAFEYLRHTEDQVRRAGRGGNECGSKTERIDNDELYRNVPGRETKRKPEFRSSTQGVRTERSESQNVSTQLREATRSA